MKLNHFALLCIGSLFFLKSAAFDSSKNKEILFDQKTGVTLSTKSKQYYEGACLAHLWVNISKGELKPENMTQAQKAWMETQVPKGRSLLAKAEAAPKGVSVLEGLFALVKNRTYTQTEGEFMAGWFITRLAADQITIGAFALAQIETCGQAGYSKRF